MADKLAFPPLEVPYRLLVGALIRREREVLGISRRLLSSATENFASESGARGLKPTVLERIENGIGACHSEHLYSICFALRLIGSRESNPVLREYSRTITPGYLLSDADTHVVRMEAAGLKVIPSYAQGDLSPKEHAKFLKAMSDDLKILIMNATCISPWMWEFLAAKLNFFLWKAIEDEAELDQAVVDQIAAELTGYEKRIRSSLLLSRTPSDQNDEIARILTSARSDLIKSRRDSYLSRDEIIELFRHYAHDSYEEVVSQGVMMDRAAFDSMKALAQYRFGLRPSPVPDSANVDQSVKDGFRHPEEIPRMSPL